MTQIAYDTDPESQARIVFGHHEDTRGEAKSLFLTALIVGALHVGIVIAALAWMMWATPADAQPQVPCAPYGRLSEELARKYGERVTGMGIINNRTLMHVFVSDKGSWSVVVVGVDGNACIVAAGQGWEQITVPVGEPS